MSRAVDVRPWIGDFKSENSLSLLARKLAPKDLLVDVARLERAYFERHPDLADSNQLIRFRTSGHRGTPREGTFTEAHVLAITQAICDYRRSHGLDGPLYLGEDTHALSVPSQRTAIEVLAGNNVETILQKDDGVTPAAVISHAILTYNRGRKNHLAAESLSQRPAPPGRTCQRAAANRG